MPWDTDLTGVGRNIAATNDTPLRVIAGPGTGKSHAMKRRTARLLEEGAEPRRILAVTFTRNAARELKNDISALGVEGCELVRAGTLHSYCFQLLQRNEVFTRIRRTPRPLVTVPNHGFIQFEASPMFRDLSDPVFGDIRARTRRVRAFEAAWARLQSEEPGWPHDPADQAFQRALESWLLFHKAILIGELIPLAYSYLNANPLAPARREWLHVLVDEYQDLNRAEQRLIDLLSEHGNLAIVGDEDQSIYGRMRHAHPEGIREFAATHVGTHDEHLNECWRCPTLVVEMANALISNNHPTGGAPRLNPRAGNPRGEVRIVQWPTAEDEARGVVAFARHLMTRRGVGAGEILILCPLRDLGYRIRELLTDAGVPAHSFYSEEPVKDLPAQEAFSFLRLLAQPNDRVALRFLLGAVNSNTWISTQYAKLRAHCEQSGDTPWEGLRRLEEREIRLPHTTQLLARFQLVRDRLRELEQLRGAELVAALFPDGQPWSSGLREAADNVLEQDANATNEELLDALVETVSHQDMPESGNFVRVMSLHKSKGLTSRVVIITGLIQNLVPRMDWRVFRGAPQADIDEQLREQRRLFYVGLTRTREILVLSSPFRIPADVARGAGLEAAGGASQFLGELGPQRPHVLPGQAWQAGGFQLTG
jgi:superfamily I DNA/RNA helicase